MTFKGKIQNIMKDWESGKFQITFSIEEPFPLAELDKIRDKELAVEADIFRAKRSLDANAMLWACCSEIGAAMTPPERKWDVYLRMLRDYGKFTYICVKPSVVDAVKAQWRESEVLGEIEINGKKAVQMLCYFGSSTYNTKEFSTLLDGVVEEMRQMNLTPPPSEKMRQALERWEREHEKAVERLHG